MILVTGATGQIGSEVVKQLAAANVKFRALVRNPEKAASLKGPNVELVKGDFTDPKSLDAAMKGVDTLFLLSNAEPNQVAMQHNAIEAAKRAGVKHVVKLSALGSDLNSPASLGRWHAQTEKELKESGLKWTILQPHFFLQNFLGSAGTIKSQGALYAPMKNGKASFVDTRDIAAVAAKILTTPGGHEGKTYIVTGPESVSLTDVAAKLSAAIGKPVKYVDVPPDAFKKSLLEAGLPEWISNDFVALYTFFSTNGAAATTPVVQDVTGKPPRNLDTFVRDYAGAFK